MLNYDIIDIISDYNKKYHQKLNNISENDFTGNSWTKSLLLFNNSETKLLKLFSLYFLRGKIYNTNKFEYFSIIEFLKDFNILEKKNIDIIKLIYLIAYFNKVKQYLTSGDTKFINKIFAQNFEYLIEIINILTKLKKIEILDTNEIENIYGRNVVKITTQNKKYNKIQNKKILLVFDFTKTIVTNSLIKNNYEHIYFLKTLSYNERKKYYKKNYNIEIVINMNDITKVNPQDIELPLYGECENIQNIYIYIKNKNFLLNHCNL